MRELPLEEGEGVVQLGSGGGRGLRGPGGLQRCGLGARAAAHRAVMSCGPVTSMLCSSNLMLNSVLRALEGGRGVGGRPYGSGLNRDFLHAKQGRGHVASAGAAATQVRATRLARPPTAHLTISTYASMLLRLVVGSWNTIAGL